jgi:hypothetical protein
MQGANRGGPGRGQGRKPVKQGEETVTLSLRVTVAQREKLARLGGAEWVRGKIDRAKEPIYAREHQGETGSDNLGPNHRGLRRHVPLPAGPIPFQRRG